MTSPARRSPALFRRGTLLVTALCLLLPPSAAHALRVVTWNLLAYDDAAVPLRRPHLLTVLPGLAPDVIIVQELLTAPAADSFASVLRAALPGRRWIGGSATFLLSAQSAVYYDSLQVSHGTFLAAIATGGPRQVLFAILRPNGYRANAAAFRLYSAHFKAGDGAGGFSPPSDSATRTLECKNLRTTLNTAPVGTNLLFGGDTNFYGSFETGYTRLTESQADNDGRLKDPYSLPGLWNQPAYAPYHSQSPCNGACIGSGGGMDDRFDMLLGSYSLSDGVGLDLVPGALPGGYGAYGNDGLHYNDSIDGGGVNTAVGLTVAAALRLASDHLPVLATLQLPAQLATVSELAFGDVIVGAVATQTLSVDNLPAPPAATLSYTFSAPAGFTAPAGAFTNGASAAPAVHGIAMSTGAAGVLSGALTVNSNDLDTTAKAVLLSGRVLAHAVPSLDSSVTQASATLDFGTVAEGSNSELGLRLYNRDHSSLQARLARSAEFVAGDTRFAFHPPSAVLVSNAATYAVTFDATGAAPDAVFAAELRIAPADEPLPGALSSDTLRVTLRARIAASAGVEGLPTVLQFSAPAPNPVRRVTTFAFDLPHAAPVSLTVYDASGRRVAVLAAGEHAAGRHQVRWQALSGEGSALRAGLYFARFSTPGFARVARLVVLP
jgi:hypothetical protein